MKSLTGSMQLVAVLNVLGVLLFAAGAAVVVAVWSVLAGVGAGVLLLGVGCVLLASSVEPPRPER